MMTCFKLKFPVKSLIKFNEHLFSYADIKQTMKWISKKC